jgi:hypothetical protein
MTSADILAYREKLRSTLPSYKPVDPNPDNPLIAPPPEATREMQEAQLLVSLDILYFVSLLSDRFHALTSTGPQPIDLPALSEQVSKPETHS